MATPKEVGASIVHLLKGFPQYEISEETTKAYIDDLTDIPGQYVWEAARILRREEDWFPSIAKWRAIAGMLRNQDIVRRREVAEKEKDDQRQIEEKRMRDDPEARARVRKLIAEASEKMGWPEPGG